jgi:hypothetical protein
LPGVHQHEAAGAVGVLHHARLEAGLAKQGALLVACHATNGDGMAQQVGVCLHHTVRWTASRLAAGLRDVQRLQQLVIPLVGVHVEQHGA